MTKRQQKGLLFVGAAGAAFLALSLWLLPVGGQNEGLVIVQTEQAFAVWPGEWGEAVDGMSCRIKSIHQQKTGDAGSPFLIEVEVRNLSDQDLHLLFFINQSERGGVPALVVLPIFSVLLENLHGKWERIGNVTPSKTIKDILILPAQSTNLVTGELSISKGTVSELLRSAQIRIEFGGQDPHGRDVAEQKKYWSGSVQSGIVKPLAVSK